MDNSTEYKEYSLTRLEDGVFDAMNSGATAREVFDTIFGAVKSEHDCNEEKMGYAADLLAYIKSAGKLTFEKTPYTEKDAVGKLNSELEQIQALGGFEWTPNSEISRNDPARLAYERGWVYESPDNGKTVTKRRVGETQKYPVK